MYATIYQILNVIYVQMYSMWIMLKLVKKKKKHTNSIITLAWFQYVEIEDPGNEGKKKTQVT